MKLPYVNDECTLYKQVRAQVQSLVVDSGGFKLYYGSLTVAVLALVVLAVLVDRVVLVVLVQGRAMEAQLEVSLTARNSGLELLSVEREDASMLLAPNLMLASTLTVLVPVI
jgi:hypothetical protein